MDRRSLYDTERERASFYIVCRVRGKTNGQNNRALRGVDATGRSYRVPSICTSSRITARRREGGRTRPYMKLFAIPLIANYASSKRRAKSRPRTPRACVSGKEISLGNNDRDYRSCLNAAR